jgi:hypothetical protein
MLKDKNLLLTILLSVVFLFVFYFDVVIDPNGYIFSPKGDGIKNYFTFINHIKNDTGFTHFSGFNYPFGDLHILTDGHSLLSWTLQLFKMISPGIENYAIGILNSLMLLSFPITSVVVYKLLKSYGVKGWMAPFFAIVIMMMAPQYTRMTGHISMSYSFFIPLIWLWVRNYNLTGKSKYTWWLSLFLFILYFTHPYMGVIGTFFILTYQGFELIVDKRRRTLKFITSIFSQGILSLILFQAYVILVNKIELRPSNKYVFGTMYADLKAVFFPHTMPLKGAFQFVFNFKGQKWESWSYIGTATLVVLLIMLFRFLLNFKTSLKKARSSKPFVIGIIGLVYGCGVLFEYGGGFLLELLPPVRQIRILARFTWIFYFCTMIFTTRYMYKVYLKYSWSNRKSVGSFIIVLIITCGVYEGSIYHSMTGEKVASVKNPFIYENLDNSLKKAISDIDVPSYQAILSFPFFQVGSDRFLHRIQNQKAFFNTLLISYHTGIPILNTCMSRTSSKQLLVVSELVTELYKESELLPLMDCSKKVLFYVHNHKKTYNELGVMKYGSNPKKYAFGKMMDFDFKAKLVNKSDEAIAYYQANKKLMHRQSNLRFKDEKSTVIFENFDSYGNSESPTFMDGKSQFGEYNKTSVLYNDKSGKLVSDEYFVSFWYYSRMDTTKTIMFVIEENQKGKPGKWTNISDTRKAYKGIGDWSYIKFKVKLAYPGGQHKIFLKGHNKLNPPIFFDHLLIWDAKETVYTEYKGWLFKDNYPLGEL